MRFSIVLQTDSVAHLQGGSLAWGVWAEGSTF
jgi:hypothetical protein